MDYPFGLIQLGIPTAVLVVELGIPTAQQNLQPELATI